MKTYAGIGSRETPSIILGVMKEVADRLACGGWTLRSGNAPGADQAFFLGHMRAVSGITPELYLPWPTFERRALSGWTVQATRWQPQPEAYAMAEEFHPAWANLKPGVRALHARNVHQILGPDVTAPTLSRFVICWTRDAAGGGGTGQALRIARHYNVPVFDLADPDAYDRVVGLFDK